jgi:hypothetical protein
MGVFMYASKQASKQHIHGLSLPPHPWTGGRPSRWRVRRLRRRRGRHPWCSRGSWPCSLGGPRPAGNHGSPPAALSSTSLWQGCVCLSQRTPGFTWGKDEQIYLGGIHACRCRCLCLCLCPAPCLPPVDVVLSSYFLAHSCYTKVATLSGVGFVDGGIKSGGTSS